MMQHSDVHGRHLFMKHRRIDENNLFQIKLEVSYL